MALEPPEVQWSHPLVVSNPQLRVQAQATWGSKLSAQEIVLKMLLRWFPPNVVQQFALSSDIPKIQKQNGEFDVFEFGPAENSSSDATISVKGSSAVALASGVYWYLRDYCNVHISWTGDQLNLPERLPTPEIRRVERLIKYSYYQNVCTVSYSSAWWNWERWEREIDWMAFNGINMPLAFTGQEYVWKNVYEMFNLTSADLEDFFSGPAFFAWQRMGNLNGWAGPLSSHFIQNQYKLQLKILRRMREFGMTPVLPAFSGRVPKALKTKFPTAGISQTGWWSGFPGTQLLSQSDPLFISIGSAFIKEQTKLYGTDHLYNCDTFNENIPPSKEPLYLKSQAQAVYESMYAADPEAIWVMQAWMFVGNSYFWGNQEIEALLSGVSNENMIILDLYADYYSEWDKTNSFYGKPFIWCQLHNFGGNYGLYGRLPYLNTAPVKALKNENSTMIGIGLTMEGIDQNYVVYDFFLEFGWRQESVILDSWVDNYVVRRYGLNEDFTSLFQPVWRILAETVYASSRGYSVTKSYIVNRPSLTLAREGFMPTNLFYPPEKLVEAWNLFVDGIIHLRAARAELPEPLHYDLVDVSRQVLSDMFISVHAEFVSALTKQTPDFHEVEKIGNQLLSIIMDMNEVVCTDSHFLLSKWINDARSCAPETGELFKSMSGKEESIVYTAQEHLEHAKLLEFNARNQITLWGPEGQIKDYASKQWCDLISSYYHERWKKFVDWALEAVAQDKEFNEKMIQGQIFQWEKEWGRQTDQTLHEKPAGDIVQIVQELRRKYKVGLH